MLYVLLALIFVAVIYLPQVWVKRTLTKYAAPRTDYPGTGADMARHLIAKMQIQDVTVERTEIGDHYNPITKQVCLSEPHLDQKSLAAVAVAAHEVGHAIQHANKEALFELRTSLAKIATVVTVAGQILLIVSPFLIGFIPAIGKWALIGGLATVLSSTVVHLITLPVEWDASFNKALPLLKEGNYLSPQDMKKANKILRAAALTYVAGSLASLLNVWRWLRILRR